MAGEDPGKANPQIGKQPGSKEADVAWTRHLGLWTSTPPAQLALDKKVTKELERAQEAARLAGKELGVDVPPRHTLVGKMELLWAESVRRHGVHRPCQPRFPRRHEPSSHSERQ